MVAPHVLSALKVLPTVSLRDAARIIQNNEIKIVLVCDDEDLLVGTVTDGDIRRAVLQSVNLDGPVSAVMNRNPKVTRHTDNRRRLKEYMRTAVVRHLPCVDDRGRLIGLVQLDEMEDVRARDAVVVLMAGGRGERLMPLTADTPKPLLKVGEKPLLERQIEQLIRHGFHRFYVSINYLGHLIENYFGDGSRFGVEIRYLRETEPLGTAGSFALMEPQNQPLMVVNGDIISKADFATMIEYFEDSGTFATIGVRDYLYTVPYGCVMLNDGHLTKIDEKPTFRHLINAGIYVFSPRVLLRAKEVRFLNMPELLSELAAAGEKINTFQITEEWIDIGRKEDLLWAQQLFAVEDKFD